MSYTAFLSSGTTSSPAVRASGTNGGEHRLIAVTRSELDFAIATLGSPQGGLDRVKAMRFNDVGLPPVVEALIKFNGSITQPETRQKDGRPVATGRNLTGLEALKTIRQGFESLGEKRWIRFDSRSIERTVSAKAPVRAFEDRITWDRAEEISASRGTGLKKQISNRFEAPRRRFQEAGIGA